jgi:hypothetical protein
VASARAVVASALHGALVGAVAGWIISVMIHRLLGWQAKGVSSGCLGWWQCAVSVVRVAGQLMTMCQTAPGSSLVGDISKTCNGIQPFPEPVPDRLASSFLDRRQAKPSAIDMWQEKDKSEPVGRVRGKGTGDSYVRVLWDNAARFSLARSRTRTQSREEGVGTGEVSGKREVTGAKVGL